MRRWLLALGVLAGCNVGPSSTERIQAYHDAVIGLCRDEGTRASLDWARACTRELERLSARLKGKS